MAGRPPRSPRTYVLVTTAGETRVHVAAVSSGNETPYPNVNNTDRWRALAASCPYHFTILGKGEAWQVRDTRAHARTHTYMHVRTGTRARAHTARGIERPALLPDFCAVFSWPLAAKPRSLRFAGACPLRTGLTIRRVTRA
jgi:hypothetical protein